MASMDTSVARKNFGVLLDRVMGRERIELRRRGRLIAAVVPVEDYELLQRFTPTIRTLIGGTIGASVSVRLMRTTRQDGTRASIPSRSSPPAYSCRSGARCRLGPCMKYTYDDRFLTEFGRLSPRERSLFLRAVAEINEAYAARGDRPLPVWPAHLRVRPMKGHPGIYEMTWTFVGPDGRATFSIAEVGGEPVIAWRRIGSHAIYGNP